MKNITRELLFGNALDGIDIGGLSGLGLNLNLNDIIEDKDNTDDDNLIDSMDRYLNELKLLNEKNPEAAKKIAKEGLIRTGIINENGELIPPYNGKNINPDDFTRGPKRVRSKND